MSDATEYQIVAATPNRSPTELRRLVDAVGDCFDVELSELADALCSSGVCVATATDLPTARQLGSKLLALGADYRILDERGLALHEESAAAALAVEARTKQPRADSRTLIGGFDARALAASLRPAANAAPEIELEDAGGFTAPDSTIAAGAVAFDLAGSSDDFEVEHITGGEAAAHAPIAIGGLEVPDGPAQTELEVPGGFISAEAQASWSAAAVEQPGPSAGRGFDLDALDADSLVMLDGSSDELPSRKSSGSGEARPATTNDAAFLPPDDGGLLETALEIEQPEPPPAGAKLPQVRPFNLPFEASQRTDTSEHYGVAPQDAPAAAPLAFERGDLLPAPSESPGDDSETPRVQAATTRSGLSGARASAASRTSAFRAGPAFGLLGPHLRQWPRLRIFAGFALALSLGAILPTCRARAVRRERIEALREDLSTAKAHGSLLAAQADFRTPAQLEEAIGALQTRTAISTILMWSALSALLLFLWFRFA